MIYKIGEKGDHVKTLQLQLNANGYNVTVDGVYGKQTNEANLSFIKQSSKTENTTVSKIASEIIKFATNCLGQEEIAGNLGFKTPWFHKAMVGVGFVKTHPWCCYFTELCYKEGYKVALPNKPEISKILDTLFSPSVMQTKNNFSNQGSKYGFKFTNVPTPGSLIIFQSGTNKGLGHIGIVEKVVGNLIYTIEGNTDKAGGREGLVVAKKTRQLDFSNTKGLNLIGFINPSDFETNILA